MCSACQTRIHMHYCYRQHSVGLRYLVVLDIIVSRPNEWPLITAVAHFIVWCYQQNSFGNALSSCNVKTLIVDMCYCLHSQYDVKQPHIVHQGRKLSKYLCS